MTGAETTLIVPVQAHALLVNDAVRATSFHRMSPDFSYLAAGQLRQDPLAGLASGDYDTSWRNDPHSNGAYVQWDLPHALTRGRAELAATAKGDHEAGLAQLTYPLVPNRWLVVRCHRPEAKSGMPQPTVAGWLVESDFVDNSGGDHPQGSPFVREGKPVNIGAARPLGSTDWQPKDTGGKRFLTADGCGIPAFHLFQCFSQEVFSVHDPLTDAAGKALASGIVSYLVAGWHSHAEDDILTTTAQGTGPLDALLNFHGYAPASLDSKDKARIGLELLGWKADTAFTPDRTLYTGAVLGLQWKTTGSPPSDMPDLGAGQVRVGLGLNTADARDALRKHDGLPSDERLLYRAFDSGRLPLLDQVLYDQDRAVQEAERDACFTAVSAGCHWAIAHTPVADGKGGVTPPPTLSADQAAALERLNADQVTYDQTARELADASRRLYDLWWLAGLPSGQGADDRACPPGQRKTLDGQLDRSAHDSLAAQVLALRDKLAQLRGKIPSGDTTRQLADAIAKAAAPLKLAAGQRLERVIHPPYRRPQDPVVLIDGAGSGPDLAPTKPLECRRHDELIDRIGAQISVQPPAPPGFTWQSVTSTQPWAPLLEVLCEFNALDQTVNEARRSPANPPETDVRTWADNNKRQAYTAKGTAACWPSSNLWNQPWEPLFLLWNAAVHSLPGRPGTADGWHFDGHHWHLNSPGNKDPHDIGGTTLDDLQGMSLLTALPRFLVRGRIHDYLQRHPDTEAELLRLLDDTATATQICQSLDGLGAYLAQYRAVAHYDPSGKPVDLSDLTSPAWAVASPNPKPWGQPVSAAQFQLTGLIVVDRFGRAYDHINSLNSAAADLARSPDLTPNTAHGTDHTPRPGDHSGNTLVFGTGNPNTFAQLQPRLQQAARALIELVSPADDHLVLSTETAPTPKNAPDSGPACGWLVPDHRGECLTVYAADGAGLGELLATGPKDKQRLDWRPLPNSPYLCTEDVLAEDFTHNHPHLGPLIQGLLERSRTGAVDAYAQLRQIIDDALKATTTPDDSHTTPWALFTGRPLAVVRARLRIELADAPHPQPTWDHLLAGPSPHDGNPLRTTAWPFRLGDASRPSDGLIGYFTSPPGTPTGYAHMHSPYAEHVPPRKGNRDRDAPYIYPIMPSAFPTAIAENTPYGAKPSPGATAWVTMLVDPFTPLHAATGILPTAVTHIPDDAIRHPLTRICLCVPTGPVLATLARPSSEPNDSPTTQDTPTDPTTLALPSPGSWHGTWAWWERTPPPADPNASNLKPWKQLDIGHTDTLVHPPDVIPDARTGYLTLTRPTTAVRGDQ
ncbi:hypothetical protein ACFCXR_23845 [Streptomyces noursei]|uniref:hypothetical protein n=1 Tax=Streptomyces noursei TaxID=1971 RepID=UPI0035E175E5